MMKHGEPDSAMAARVMTQAELLRRKAELEQVLAVLTEHTLGEISYPLGERTTG